MKPITFRQRWALEYDQAFTEWLNQFEDGKEIKDPYVLVFNEIAMNIPSISAFRVATIVREDVEEETEE
jgi:hypothetical protein